MTAPVFEFTDRARPVVQFGRSEHPVEGEARWGRAHWGVAHWSRVEWDPIWTDVTCEIHEITVDVGRAGAVDRFKPGTAAIVASNIHNLSDMVWPPVIPPIEYELVPQPPIVHEEDLQAPDAATVVSNGWSFSDDFETVPPRWMFPAAYATTGTYPTVPFLWGDGHVTPETYGDTAGTGHEAHGALQWTGLYPDLTTVEALITIEGVRWLAAPSAGTAQCVVDLYVYGNRNDRAANCWRFTLTPVFAGANTMTVQLLDLAVDGTTLASTPTETISTGLGTNAVFPTLTLRALADPSTGAAAAEVNDLANPSWGWSDWAAGERLGFAVHYRTGTVTGGQQAPPPQVTSFAGPDFDDDFARPTGSGWKVNRKYSSYGAMIVEGGAMRPPMRPVDGTDFNGRYLAQASAQWVSDFDGDQVIEVDVTGMSQPTQVSAAGTNFELSLKGFPRDLRSVVAVIGYEPHWGTSHSRINWSLLQYGPNGEIVYDPDVDGESFGSIDLGATAGIFPDATWRLEAGTVGDVRLYHQTNLLGHALFPDIPDGGRIGVYEQWGSGGNLTSGARRGSVARIERLAGGLRSPLGTEELGTWIRIGVDHDELGHCWLFRGFVDGIVPTYVPDRPDAVRLECIDALGEAGRVQIDGEQVYHRFAAAPTRIRQILDAAHWPAALRDVHDDSTLMSRPPAGTAVEAMTRVAESCGGAVYGDPVSGHVVFRGRDWQGSVVADGPTAAITNFPDVDIEPQVCPVGWEMSKRRSDIITRVRFTSVTSDSEEGTPIVREWRSPQAERIYGVELYEATLLCITGEVLSELAVRELRIEGARDMPRIEACLLDASTAPEALDLMATATFTRPTTVRCQLHRPGNVWVINRNYIVTGQRHVMKPERWTCRLALDLSSPFFQGGGRWGERLRPRGRWGVDVWARNF